jgi:hypothetical protein
MNQPTKLVLGAATIAPLLISGWIFVWMLGEFNRIATSGGSTSPDQFGRMFEEFLSIVVVSTVLSLGLLIFYMWHVFVKRAGMDGTQQVLWAIGFVMFGIVVMPIYWVMFILPDAAMREQAERISDHQRRTAT